MEIRADQVVRERARVREMTEDLRQREPISENRERTRFQIAWRFLESREID
jgi:hypothetical protein